MWSGQGSERVENGGTPKKTKNLRRRNTYVRVKEEEGREAEEGQERDEEE
jgi:hypothetical protein